jgi:cardiolipin synthase
LIDDYISYIGSANITASCLKWREMVLRIEGGISKEFNKAFEQVWQDSHIFKLRKPKIIHYKNFDIIPDVASHFYTPTRKKYLKMIKQSEKSILIETPYFVPPFRIRNALKKAVKRGVEVNLITPHFSDARILDIIKEKYFGRLHKNGINIYYYKPKVLHSKYMVVDGAYFILGSSNIDYRSFIYQYELNLCGEDKKIAESLAKNFYNAIKESEAFNYVEWKNRPFINKFLERLFYLFRTFF